MIRCSGLKSAAPALAGLLVLTFAQALVATEGELKGHIEFFMTSPSPGPFAILENQGWYSRVQPLGQVGGAVTVNVTTTTDGVVRSGNILLCNAKGDALYLYYEVFRSVVLGGPGQGSFVVLSGAGKYQGATGGGTITQYFIPSNATDIDGRISY